MTEYRTGDPVFLRNGDSVFRYEKFREVRPANIEPGYYDLCSDLVGLYLRHRRPPESDETVSLKTGVTKDILADIDNFNSEETKAAFKRYGFIHRRGVILHGPQGTGKSVIFKRICEKFVDSGGIVFWDPDPEYVAVHSEEIRKRIPAQPMLVVWEELDDWLREEEHNILQLLDGHNTINNCVYLASTNNFDKLPPRIKNRPSRFARVFEVGPPNAQMREEFFLKKIHPEDLKQMNSLELKGLIKDTEGLVIDHLKEIILSVFCMRVPLKEAIERARNMDLTEDD